VKEGTSQFQNFRADFHKFMHGSLQNHSYAMLPQVLCKMGSENAHGCAQNAEHSFSFDFFDQYHKNGDKFLIHII
jgi:hypothetical protein